MGNHFELDDRAFEAQLESCTLNPDYFTHEAHIRLAWIHLSSYGKEQAIENICKQLQNFVNVLGAGEKYNKTLTIAAIKMVHHFMQKSKAVHFKDFIADFPRLLYNFRELIEYHYATDIFNSPEAKEVYLAPDRNHFE